MRVSMPMFTTQSFPLVIVPSMTKAWLPFSTASASMSARSKRSPAPAPGPSKAIAPSPAWTLSRAPGIESVTSSKSNLSLPSPPTRMSAKQAARERVAVALTTQGVGAVAAEQNVDAVAAEQPVVVVEPAEGIGPAVAGQQVGLAVARSVDVAGAGQRQMFEVRAEGVADAREDFVDAGLRIPELLIRRVADVVDNVGVILVAAVHEVGAGSTVEHVLADVAEQAVAAAEPGEDIVVDSPSITLSPELPVPLTFPRPISVRFSMLALSVKLTLEKTKSTPPSGAPTVSLTVSPMLST